MVTPPSSQTKIIVLDDDPTGSQTVHSCLLLTKWDVETLRIGLADASPIMFVLTNTRSLTPSDAAAVTREVCQNLKLTLEAEKIQDFMIVSRSDSTLRGHYPIETDVIAEELGDFDAHFLVPAFFEGGRFTKSSVHYLVVNGVPTPVHETEFAKDSVFGYQYSYLPDYVAEKTQDRIPAEQVERFLLSDIRAGSRQRLAKLHDNQCGVVDAENQADLNQFAADILAIAATGKKFLFRSAASLLTALAKLPPQPIPAEEMSKYMRSPKAGVAIVGSHVKKTTEQLENLLEADNTVPVEIDVARLLNNLEAEFQTLKQEALSQVQQAHSLGKTAVVFTSRKELEFADIATRLAFGQSVSALLMAIVQELPEDIGFLISKGGITSNDVLSTGLNLPTARLLGQILAGCSVVKTPADHPRFPDLPVVLFPGNVGDANALATVYTRLAMGIHTK
ncbi:MAG: Hrp-dependent type III effector protein [Oscillatoriales cyanobacterium CG2_30_44_21]|nr:MAG: Hrp-dependent type III effector protein [Oscillatoriales cyanobacterium CG2_30_44_21]